MTGLPTATPITLILGYDIRHSSRNALDYLTSYNRINNPPHMDVFGHSPETIDPTIGTVFSGPPSSTFTIPAPSGVPQPSTSYANLVASEGLDAVKMSLWGGTISNIVYVTQGDLTAAISEAQIAVTFTASSPTAVLAWGGHIASRADWGFTNGVPNSAGGISGSPYHMRLVNWYGTTPAITKQLGNLGNQDRSLSAVAVYVPPGRIIVDKVTVPSGSPQSFSLTGGPDAISQSFSLTDTATPYDSGTIKPGVYAVSETVPAGWDLTSAVCSDGSLPSAIDLSAGETVTVTFTDTKRGKIIVDKVTVPSGSLQLFDFLVTGPMGYSDSFSLTDADLPHDSGWILPGTYAASETVPAGWDLTSAVCSDGSPASAIVLDPGETVTVTFTDTKHVFYTGTIGYWMNHPEKWPTAIIAPDDPFPWTTGALAGKSYMEILWTNPEGDASIQLARQYIGAKLNQLVFGVPADIAAKIAEAEAWLTTYPAGSNPPKSSPERAAIVALAAELEAYNSSGLPPPP